LDHQELMGKALGREGILPALQGTWYVWHEQDGLCSGNQGCLNIPMQAKPKKRRRKHGLLDLV
jgi:hypothetical protein